MQPYDINPVRTLVVGDDPLVREGFGQRLGDAFVGEASSADDLIAALTQVDANVILLDLGPSGDHDVALMRRIDRVPVPVLALGTPAHRGRELLDAGVAGVLPRGVEAKQLSRALDSVLHGLVVLDPAWIPRVEFAEQTPTSLPEPPTDLLTPREREVVQLMAEGRSNKQIAAQLGISAHTAKFHVNAVLAKLDAKSRTEAVVHAVQRGMVMI